MWVGGDSERACVSQKFTEECHLAAGAQTCPTVSAVRAPPAAPARPSHLPRPRMRALLDPSWRREFGGHPVAAESLPSVDVRRFAPRRLPRRIELLADPQRTAEATSRQLLTPAQRAQPRLADAEASRRALWKSGVRAWMRQHDCEAASREWEVRHPPVKCPAARAKIPPRAYFCAGARSRPLTFAFSLVLQLPRADERVLLEWFDAIDVDRNGEVDADEIRALLASNQAGCSPARLEALFQLAGKRVGDGLRLHDFVKVMHLGGAAMLFQRQFVPPNAAQAVAGGGQGAHAGAPAGSGASGHSSHELRSPGGATGSPSDVYTEQASMPPTLAECRSDGDLAVMAYRRQRVLNDLREPTRRSAFASHEAFLRKYVPGALPAYRERWVQRTEGTALPTTPTDAERRMAADGNFFQQQLSVARDAEAAEAEAEAQRERAASEAVRAAARARSLPKLHRAGTQVRLMTAGQRDSRRAGGGVWVCGRGGFCDQLPARQGPSPCALRALH